MFKGKKMAGHMGDRQRTQQNLEVVRTDADRGSAVHQGLGSRREEWLAAGRDAVKVPMHGELPFPGAMLGPRTSFEPSGR